MFLNILHLEGDDIEQLIGSESPLYLPFNVFAQGDIAQIALLGKFRIFWT